MQLFTCGPAVDVRRAAGSRPCSAAKDLAWSSAAKFNLTTKLLCQREVKHSPTDTSDGFNLQPLHQGAKICSFESGPNSVLCFWTSGRDLTMSYSSLFNLLHNATERIKRGSISPASVKTAMQQQNSKNKPIHSRR